MSFVHRGCEFCRMPRDVVCHICGFLETEPEFSIQDIEDDVRNCGMVIMSDYEDKMNLRVRYDQAELACTAHFRDCVRAIGNSVDVYDGENFTTIDANFPMLPDTKDLVFATADQPLSGVFPQSSEILRRKFSVRWNLGLRVALLLTMLSKAQALEQDVYYETGPYGSLSRSQDFGLQTFDAGLYINTYVGSIGIRDVVWNRELGGFIDDTPLDFAINVIEGHFNSKKEFVEFQPKHWPAVIRCPPTKKDIINGTAIVKYCERGEDLSPPFYVLGFFFACLSAFTMGFMAVFGGIVGVLYYAWLLHSYMLTTPFGLWIYKWLITTFGVATGIIVFKWFVLLSLSVISHYIYTSFVRFMKFMFYSTFFLCKFTFIATLKTPVFLFRAVRRVWRYYNSLTLYSFVKEMAIPGSMLTKYSNSRHPNVAAILIYCDDKQWHFIAMCSRYQNHLVTAFHTFSTKPLGSQFAIAPARFSKGTWTYSEEDKVDFDSTSYIEEFSFFDVFAKPMDNEFWSKIRLTESKRSNSGCYGDVIQTFGYVGGVLFTSQGPLMEHSHSEFPNNTHMAHGSSTLKGFSGTPLRSHGGAVRGIHLGSDAHAVVNLMFRIDHISRHVAPEKELTQTVYVTEDSESVEERVIEHVERQNGKSGRSYRNNFDDDRVDHVSQNGKLTYTEFLRREEEHAKQPAKPASNILKLISKPLKPTEWAWEDENAKTPAPEMSKAKVGDNLDSEHFVVVEKCEVLRCPSPKIAVEQTTEILTPFMEEFERLGYTAGEYEMPQAGYKMDTCSVINAINHHGEQMKNCPTPITDEEIDKVSMTVTAMCAALAFVPRVGYKTFAAFEAVVNSSRIQDSKSPGMPYLADGMPTNASVIEKVGIPGLFAIMMNDWRDNPIYRAFLKYEPTKIKKIREWMARVILSFPLHKTIQNILILQDALEVKAVLNGCEHIWYTFNPLKSGAISNLYQRFANLTVWESDKKKWDTSVRDEFFRIVANVMCNLAIQHPEMSNEEFAEFKVDLYESIMQVSAPGTYQLNGGLKIKSKWAGYMKSGYFGTIYVNSLMQVVCHVIALYRMGCSYDFIRSLPFVAGGDDVLQHLPDHLVEAYIKAHASFGIELEMKRNDSFEGCTYFGNKFHRDERGRWYFVPERFCKHISSLLLSKPEDLFASIGSRIENWAFVPKVVELFERIKSVIRVNYAHLYDDKQERSVYDTHMKVFGYECEPLSKQCEPLEEVEFTQEKVGEPIIEVQTTESPSITPVDELALIKQQMAELLALVKSPTPSEVSAKSDDSQLRHVTNQLRQITESRDVLKAKLKSLEVEKKTAVGNGKKKKAALKAVVEDKKKVASPKPATQRDVADAPPIPVHMYRSKPALYTFHGKDEKGVEYWLAPSVPPTSTQC